MLCSSTGSQQTGAVCDVGQRNNRGFITNTYTMYTMHVPRQKQGTRCEPPTFPFSKTETTTVVNATTTLHFSYCCCLLLVMGHLYSVSLRFRGSQIGGGVYICSKLQLNRNEYMKYDRACCCGCSHPGWDGKCELLGHMPQVSRGGGKGTGSLRAYVHNPLLRYHCRWGVDGALWRLHKTA